MVHAIVSSNSFEPNLTWKVEGVSKNQTVCEEKLKSALLVTHVFWYFHEEDDVQLQRVDCSKIHKSIVIFIMWDLGKRVYTSTKSF